MAGIGSRTEANPNRPLRAGARYGCPPARDAALRQAAGSKGRGGASAWAAFLGTRVRGGRGGRATAVATSAARNAGTTPPPLRTAISALHVCPTAHCECAHECPPAATACGGPTAQRVGRRVPSDCWRGAVAIVPVEPGKPCLLAPPSCGRRTQVQRRPICKVSNRPLRGRPESTLRSSARIGPCSACSGMPLGPVAIGKGAARWPEFGRRSRPRRAVVREQRLKSQPLPVANVARRRRRKLLSLQCASVRVRPQRSGNCVNDCDCGCRSSRCCAAAEGREAKRVRAYAAADGVGRLPLPRADCRGRQCRLLARRFRGLVAGTAPPRSQRCV